MVRFINNLANTERRLETAGRAERLPSAKWVDMFPEIHGTVPEKMVYAELTRRGIPFLFLNDIRFQIPEIDFDKWYQADFVMPDLKLIIEVQGAYWHSMPKTIDEDAYKFAIYQTTGWRALAWWDYDILERLQDLFLAEPLLTGATNTSQRFKSTELPVQRRTKIDTSKGIRTLNSRRFKAKNVTVSKRSLRKSIGGIF